VPPSFQTRAPFIRYVIIGILLVVFTVTRPKGIIGEERQVSRF
jgi:ABC-type branched-subunit amino acid transport system permease subunit